MRYANDYETHNLGWSTISTLLARYRWLILSVFLMTLVTGLGVLQIFFNDLYETQATILVKVGRETTEVPSTIVNGSLLSQGVRIQDINSEVQLLSARKLVEDAIDKVGLDRFKNVLKAPDSIWGYPKYILKTVARFAKEQYKEVLYALSLKKRLTPREDIIVGVSESLKVEPVKESDVLVLKLRLPSAELAVETANEILSGYLRSRGNIRRNAAALDYYGEQTKVHRQRMQDLETERARIREAWGLSAAPEQRSLLLKQASDLEAGRVELEGQVRKLEQERDDMAAKLAALPAKMTKEETFMRNPALQSLKERITNLQMERAKMQGRYQDGAEPIKQLDAEIGSLQASLQGESPTILAASTAENNPLFREFEKGLKERQVAITGLRSRLKKLEEPQAELKKKLEAINMGGDAYERIERDYRIAEQSYMAFYKRMSEARLSEELDLRHVENVSVISPPTMPFEPIYPRKLFIMGILLPVGLVLGIGIAALIETMNDRVRNEDDLLEQIPDLPLLGAIDATFPAAGDYAEEKAKKRRRARQGGSS